MYTSHNRILTCICLNDPDNSSGSFGFSELLSSQTKQLNRAHASEADKGMNMPLKIISVRSSSSPLKRNITIRNDTM